MKNILCVAAIAALSATVSSAACGEEDQVHALAMNMYHEARGEGYERAEGHQQSGRGGTVFPVIHELSLL